MAQDLHSAGEFSLPGDIQLFRAFARKRYLLVTGPLLFPSYDSETSRSSYMASLLRNMVEWCIKREVITNEEVIRHMRVLLQEEALFPLLLYLEEYLPTTQDFQSCMREVVSQTHVPIDTFSPFFTATSFSGYITTTYDAFLEHLHWNLWQQSPLRLSLDSLPDVILDSEQPFLLHLYGESNTTTPRDLRLRLAGTYSALVRDRLHHLGTNTPVLFLGFESTDPDLVLLQEAFEGREMLMVSLLPTDEPNAQSHLLNKEPFSDQQHEHLSDPLQEQHKSTSPNGQPEEAPASSARTLGIFLSYVSHDKVMKQRLMIYLEVLQRQYKDMYDIYVTLTDRDNIGAGLEWKKQVEHYLAQAHVILLLVSIDFLHSEFCTEVEMTRALERHKANEARVIPIILDSCSWWNEVFHELKVLPEDGKPVNDWRKKDKAFASIFSGIEQAIRELMKLPLKKASKRGK